MKLVYPNRLSLAYTKFASLLLFQEFVMEGEVRKVAARTTDSHQERTLMLVRK